jgi:hypothetical protein
MLQPSYVESYKGCTCFAISLKLLLAVLGASDLSYQYLALPLSLLLRRQAAHVAEEVCKVNIVCRGWRQYGVC